MVSKKLKESDFSAFVQLMEGQPLPLKRKISEVLEMILKDKEAGNWLSGTEKSRAQATRKMIREAYEHGSTPEEIELRIAGLNLLMLCLSRALIDARNAVEELRSVN